MALGSGGDELHRAELSGNVPTGGLTQDEDQATATEDRVIHGISIGKSQDQVGVEVSFSSTTAFISDSLGKIDATKSQVLHFADTEVETIQPGGPLGTSWDAGEELHVHLRNNTGAAEAYRVLVYYKEA